ncbi:DNA methylase [Brevundimonas phage vB_BpoS-Kabachok]|uniref:DNA methylase n=1 Tax=Brevundimonas phage vB_BpoS-Kabachok TaxID=2948600 RepID=A0A9E7MQG7_9CAUD|nr:DNA methylase [Brevundimonas phage vB_BpoS-Kabachok]
MIALPQGTFDVVLADPPWEYHGQQDKMGAAANHYPTMPDADLLAFPMRQLLSDNGVLFMWVTAPRLDFAIDCLRAWKLHYRGVAFVWIKTKMDGTPIGAQGVRPSIVKPLTEYVLAASPVAKGRPMKLASEKVVQTVFAPRAEHSRKPDDVHERIEALYPEATKIELFARRARPGWALWGNQAPDPIHI